jgi:hypothetical protein
VPPELLAQGPVLVPHLPVAVGPRPFGEVRVETGVTSSDHFPDVSNRAKLTQ